jgi:DNA repair protein SbcD/Mre11
MRFLHIADAHLDTAFAGRSEEVRSRLREASHEAFRAAVDLAIREDVHALLIAGDLFDGDRLSFQTERFLLQQSGRLNDHGVSVVYATGNHDPGSPRAGPRSLAWPTCVRVAPDATPRRFAIHDASHEVVGHVTAVGHAESTVSEDLSRLFPMPGGDLPEVALLHTQVHSSAGASDHHAYAPSELTWLRHAGYDYWALGHVHVRQELSEDPPIWYAGSLQGKTHGDRGARGALLVDLSDRAAPAVAFRSLAPVRWDTLDVDRLDGMTTLDELERRIQSVWRSARNDDPGDSGTDWMVRVLLSGPCPLWSELRASENLDMLGQELRGILGALDVTVLATAVHPVIPLDEHRLRTDVIGEALRLSDALQRREGSLDHVLEGSLAGAGADEPAAMRAYVRRLLDGADGELAALLLEEPGS